jgi:carbon storage regulator
MLVLTRREGESFTVGDDVEIEILDIKPGVIRIGIKAPRSVRVMRSELIAAVAASNQEAAVDADALGAAGFSVAPAPVRRSPAAPAPDAP